MTATAVRPTTVTEETQKDFAGISAGPRLAEDALPLLRFENLTKRFDTGTVAVDEVTLAVPRGQFCVLLGASGAGKSTLLRAVNGMVMPTSGTITFDNTIVNKRTLRQVQPRIAMIHQQFHLVGRLGVLDNVLTGALPRISTLAAWLHHFPQEYVRRAMTLLAEVGLGEEHLYRRAASLSGGQQQRVAIARAFLLSPDMVLADEPVASLDPNTSRVILSLLREASRRLNTTVLCSLHQVELAQEFADRIVGMQAGRVVFDGLPSELDEETQTALYKRQEENDGDN